MTCSSSDRRRGVSPVVGLVLLMGLIAVVAIALFVAGTSLSGAAQQSVEDKQAGDSFSVLSSEIDRLVTGETDTESFVVDGAEDGTTSVEPNAGRIEVMLEENGTRTTLYDESLGEIRYVSSGDHIAYQGGGLWRGAEDGDSVLLEAPSFDYRSEPAPTLTLPVVSVRGTASEQGEFSGRLSVERRSDVYPAGPGHENPLRADRVIVDVESRYCSGWETYVNGSTDGQVVEHCGQAINTTPGEFRAELPVADIPTRNVSGTPAVNTTVRSVPPSATVGSGPGSSVVTVDEPTVRNGTGSPDAPPANVSVDVDPGEPNESSDQVYGLYIEDDVSLSSIGGQIQGSLGSGGAFSGDASGINQNGSIDSSVSPSRQPHDDEIRAILDEANASQRVTDFCGGRYTACSYSGPRTIVVDEDEFNGGGRDVEFDVSAGNITLVVDGDLETTPPTNWEVTGHESGHSLNVYSTGDLSIGGSVYKTPDTSLNPFQPVTRWDDIRDQEYHPEALTFYAPSTAEVSVANGVRIEGSISAPGASTSGGSMSHQQVGAIYIGEWDVTSSSLNLYPAPGSYGRPVDEGGPSGPGTIDVDVVDDATGDGLEDAIVGVSNDSGVVTTLNTSADGSASVEVTPGNYSVVVDHLQYAGETIPDVPVRTGATTTVNVSLPEDPDVPSTGTLRGEVVNGSSPTNAPIENASVEVTYAGNGSIADSLRTRPDGGYDLTLPNGTYDVVIDHPDYNATPVTTVEVAANDTTRSDASLAPVGRVPTHGSMSVDVFNGTLVGPNGTMPMDGTSVDGASVEVSYPNGSTATTGTTAANGTVEFRGLPASVDYTVNVTATDYQSNAYAGVPVNASGTTTVDVPMRPDAFSSTGYTGRNVTDTKLYYLHVSEAVVEVEDS